MILKYSWSKTKCLLMFGFNVALFYALWRWFSDNIHVPVLFRDIAHIHFSSLVGVLILDLLVSFFYGYRLMKLIGKPFATAWGLVCIGNGLNNILPFRLGDVARVYCGREYYQVEMNQLISATFVERYCDLILLLVFGLFFCFSGQSGFNGLLSAVFSVLLLCGASSFLIYRSVIAGRGRMKQWLDSLPVVSAIVDHLRTMTSSRLIKKILGLSLLVWFGTILIYYLFFSINLTEKMDFPEATLLCFTTTLAFAIPYMIAGIGVRSEEHTSEL